MATQAKAATAASTATSRNGTGKKTIYPLPSPRLNQENSLELIRALVSISTDGGRHEPMPVNNNQLGTVMDIHPTTIATANPFFADIGLILKGPGGYMPCDELIEFHRLYEWNKETAATALQPIFASSWFAKTLVPKLRIRSMSYDEAIGDLAQAAKAGPTFRSQLETLIFYLKECGLIEERDGKLVASKISPTASASPQSEAVARSETHQASEAKSEPAVKSPSVSPFGLAGDQGAIQFSINVQVDMKEFAGWTSDRITAFFGGIAAVLAAKGDEQVSKE